LREDIGRAYLHLMRNLDHTRKAGNDYTPVVDTRRVPYPVQVIWSADDLTLPLRRHGWKARTATGLPTIQTLPGKHYFQEDHAPELVAMVAEFASRKD
jgi:surfactin synthase thioesterase subunit